jgi:DNA mismatch endonuclease (patch repair protein)
MSRIRSKNTTPELVVRKILYKNGYRYRLHDSTLPGKPDIVFRGKKKAILVNGCFWHGHDCKRGAYTPKTNTEYWVTKIKSNVSRTQYNINLMQQMGWEVLTVWECELKDLEFAEKKIYEFMQ